MHHSGHGGEEPLHGARLEAVPCAGAHGPEPGFRDLVCVLNRLVAVTHVCMQEFCEEGSLRQAVKVGMFQDSNGDAILVRPALLPLHVVLYDSRSELGTRRSLKELHLVSQQCSRRWHEGYTADWGTW